MRIRLIFIISLLSIQFVLAQNGLAVPIKKTVTIAEYFHFIDSLIVQYDSLYTSQISEHHIVRNNPWIIDSLANTDYYRMTERDSFVYDQKKLIILRVNDTIIIPDHDRVVELDSTFKRTYIDVNIPEFKLRIFQDNQLIQEFPIRVGQNKKRYLAMSGRLTDLKTKTGNGEIIRHNRNPIYFNPVNGERFYVTRRDDDRVTLMPQIPWMETRINGVKNGQMIHPTTNPETLEKAYSNGCIGTRESDAWIIYYYAPIGTSIQIRYDIDVAGENGNRVKLPDVYGNKSQL